MWMTNRKPNGRLDVHVDNQPAAAILSEIYKGKETILEITITHKTPEEIARQYSFNPRQNEYLALMSEPENQNLWAELLGGYTSGGGQIVNPNTDWVGTSIFQWPLPQSYTPSFQRGQAHLTNRII